MEADAQRLKTRYVSVHRASKGQDASTVSFNSPKSKTTYFTTIKMFTNLHAPFTLQAFMYNMERELRAALLVSELTHVL